MSHSIFCQQVLCYAKKIWATDIITKLSIYGWGKIILMIMTLTIIIIIGDNNDDADDFWQCRFFSCLSTFLVASTFPVLAKQNGFDDDYFVLCTEFLWHTFKHSSFSRKISLSLSKSFYISSQLFCNICPFFIICKVIIIDSTQQIWMDSRKSPEIWQIALHYWVLMGRHLGGKNSLSEFISFGSNSLCKKTFSSCDW